MLIGLLCLSLLVAPAVRADGPIEVQANDHAYTFGDELRFHLAVSGDTSIESIVLSYRTSDSQGTTVETMAFDPAKRVAVDHAHQIGDRYVRPFVDIAYWWTITDADGATLVTEPVTFVYADDRFAWQSIEQDGVNLHWYEGSIQVAQQALNVSVAAVARAREDIRIEGTPDPIQIYLYAGATDLNLALPAGLPFGADALTLHGTTVVVAPLAPEPANIPDLKRILAHEVTHATIYEATQSELDRVPMWLSEGLATSIQHEFAPDPDAQILLQRALAAEEAIDLAGLCTTFPQDWSQARLAYAASASLVDYVRDTYGRQALQQLVAAYADGLTCEGGVQRVLSISLDRLESSWRESVSPRGGWQRFWRVNSSWVVLLVAFSVLALLIARPRELWRSVRQEEAE
jgi:hypothetical protein